MLEAYPGSFAAAHRARATGNPVRAAIAALAEAGSAFAPLYGETRLGAGHFAQFGTADVGSNETVLMERALAV